VLIPGRRAPRLVTEEMVKSMQPGSVIIDVAIDQGGSIETIDRVTSHSEPTYVKYDVVHYAVPNIPGAVPRTSTIALTNVTIPYAVQIASKGLEKAISENRALARGVNVLNGQVTYQAVAESLNLPYVPLNDVLGRPVQ
jgi:alanine dehydrogenase